MSTQLIPVTFDIRVTLKGGTSGDQFFSADLARMSWQTAIKWACFSKASPSLSQAGETQCSQIFGTPTYAIKFWARVPNLARKLIKGALPRSPTKG